MKKNLVILIAGILLTGALSCQKQAAPVPATQDNADVVLSVSGPAGALTRSFLDDASGLTAESFQLLAYQVEGEGEDLQYTYLPGLGFSRTPKYNTQTHQFEMHVSVLRGNSYCFVVLASSEPDAGYYVIDTDQHTLAMGEVPLNCPGADLFYTFVPPFDVPEQEEEADPVEPRILLNEPENPIELKRPFAQINLLAEANALAPEELTFTSLTVAGVPESLDLFTGEVSEATLDFTFAESERIASGTQLDGAPDGAIWLASGFVIAPAAETEVIISWEAVSGETHFSQSTAAQITRNVRTNITGSILKETPNSNNN